MSDHETRQAIWKHIQRIGTCMLVTYGAEHPRARPMRGIPRPEQNVIWFITDANAEHSAEMERNPAACLTYVDTSDQNYVSVYGSIAPVQDRAQLAELWNEGAEVYFPNGRDDPSVALLKFIPTQGEYWDAPSNPIVLAIKFLQAKVTSERPDLGIHEQASLS